MVNALVFNPGSNSLKFEWIEMEEGQRFAGEGKKRVSAAIEDFGEKATLSVFEGRTLEHTEECDAADMGAATRFSVEWLKRAKGLEAGELGFVVVRVVHGGTKYGGAVRFDDGVKRDIEELEELAPLHNKSSLEILDVLADLLPETDAYVTFDTAFHRTLPEEAWRYPVERETADKYGVRKFGFHGVSHRYLLEQYARTKGKKVEDVTIVTLHLESGSSAAAISRGRSVDTTMGLTPLEGLMMGSRCGSVDPSIIPYLMKKEGKSVEEVMTLLNKKSGLLGIAGGSLDTRVLEKREDEAAKLALRMFGYRVKLAVGAYLAALGDAEAVVFGGGIGEDSPWLRAEVCKGMAGWGVELDEAANASKVGQVRVSKAGSRVEAWAMPSEEGLQMAFECLGVLQEKGR